VLFAAAAQGDRRALLAGPQHATGFHWQLSHPLEPAAYRPACDPRGSSHGLECAAVPHLWRACDAGIVLFSPFDLLSFFLLAYCAVFPGLAQFLRPAALAGLLCALVPHRRRLDDHWAACDDRGVPGIAPWSRARRHPAPADALAFSAYRHLLLLYGESAFPLFLSGFSLSLSLSRSLSSHFAVAVHHHPAAHALLVGDAQRLRCALDGAGAAGATASGRLGSLRRGIQALHDLPPWAALPSAEHLLDLRSALCVHSALG